MAPIKRARRKSIEKEEPQEYTEKKTIPTQQVKEFVGKVKNLYKIDCIHLWNDFFRINVWTKQESENSIYDKNSLDRSFFVSYNGLEISDRSNPKQKEL